MRGFIVLAAIAIILLLALAVVGGLKILTSRRNPKYLLAKQAAQALRDADKASREGRHLAMEGHLELYKALQRELEK